MEPKQMIGLLVQASLFLMIAAVAMESDWRSVLAHLRQPARLLRAIIAVNVVVPLLAFILVKIMALDPPVAAGLILMSVSPLAPLVPGNALKSGADRSDVLALYAVLIALAIFLVPLTVVIINPFFAHHANAPIALIARIVVVSGLLPIVLGLAFAALLPALARRAARVLKILSNLILLLFVLLLLWAEGREFLELLGDGTIIAFACTAFGALLAGYWLGGPDRTGRATLGITAAIRHPGMAIAISQASGGRTQTTVAILLFLLNSAVIVALYQAWLRRSAPGASPSDAPSGAAD